MGTHYGELHERDVWPIISVFTLGVNVPKRVGVNREPSMYSNILDSRSILQHD